MIRRTLINHKLPITVIITTKNEEANLPTCLQALNDFEQIIVVDSNSADQTQTIAKQAGATVLPFTWNGTYPKKRQYCLDHFSAIIRHDWVFFVDADEIVTPKLVNALKDIDYTDGAVNTAGYFIRGQYLWNGKTLNFGMQNNKIALINRQEMAFPVVDDLDITPGVGEMEGHYQPILKEPFKTRKIGRIKAPLLHNACQNRKDWHARHARYAHWEDEMDRRHAWPHEDHKGRQCLKSWFKRLPPWAKAAAVFTHSYIFKVGFLDGYAGLSFARLRMHYYQR